MISFQIDLNFTIQTVLYLNNIKKSFLFTIQINKTLINFHVYVVFWQIIDRTKQNVCKKFIQQYFFGKLNTQKVIQFESSIIIKIAIECITLEKYVLYNVKSRIQDKKSLKQKKTNFLCVPV